MSASYLQQFLPPFSIMWRWHPLLETLDPRFCSCTHSHKFHEHSAKKQLRLLEAHTELSPLLTILTAPWQLVPISILEQNLAQFFTKIVLNPHVDEKPPHGFVLDVYCLTYSQVGAQDEHGILDPTIGGHLGNHHCPKTHARWACELLCGCDLESMQEHGQGVAPRVMPNYFQKSQLLDGNEGPGYSAHPEKLDYWLLFQPKDLLKILHKLETQKKDWHSVWCDCLLNQ